MKIFDIVQGKVVLIPQSLGIPEFKKIWDRDKSKAKERAYNEISYITFMCDPTSDNPYRGYETVEREKVLKQDFIRDVKWKPDEVIKAAMGKFDEMLQTTNSRLLKGAKAAADKLSVYFENIDFDEVGADGKPVYSARDLSSNLSSVGNIVKSLSQLESMVKREQLESSKTRGGGEIGLYEVPREDFNYGE